MAEQAGKSKKITHTYFVNMKTMDGETQNIACGDGLSLRISPKDKKSWYLHYDTMTAEGKRKQSIISLGTFTKDFVLKEARANATNEKTLLRPRTQTLRG